MGVDLCELVRNSLVDVAEELKDAVVFVDKEVYDVIEWTVGVAFLVGLGIRSIDITSNSRQNILSSPFFFDDDAEGDLKLLFFTSQFLWDVFDTMETIIQSKNFTSCAIYSGMSEIAHMAHPSPPSSSLRQSPYDYYANKISSIISSRATKKSDTLAPGLVVHFPLTASVFITKNSILLPTVADFSPIFPVIPPSPKPGGGERDVVGLQMKEYPEDQIGVHKLVHTLAGLLSQLGAGDVEFYGLGPTAQTVCREVHSAHQVVRDSPHPPPAQRTLALVLVDRTLDLAGPVAHTDFALDRICTLLRSPIPPTPSSSSTSNTNSNSNNNKTSNNNTNTNNDNTNTKTNSYTEHESDQSYYPTFPRANIAHFFPTAFQGQDVLWAQLPHPGLCAGNVRDLAEVVATKAWKDTLTAVRRRIVEECTHAGIDLSTIKAVSGNVTPQALLSLATQLHRKIPFKHTHLVQLIGVLVLAANLAPQLRWDQFMSIEKLFMMSIRPEGAPDPEDEEEAQEEESLATSIAQVLTRPVAGSADRTARYSVREALLLTVFAYSLMGEKEFSWKDEKLLQDTILNLIMDYPQNQRMGWLGDLEDIIKARQLLKEQNATPDEEQEQQIKRELRDCVEGAFERLHHVAHARARTPDYRNIAFLPRGSPTATYTPLLSQVLRDILQRGEAIARTRHATQSLAGAMGSLFKKFSSAPSSASARKAPPA